MVSSRLTPVDIQRVQRDTKRKVFRVTAPMALRLFFSGQSYYICKYTVCIDGILLYLMVFQLTVSLDSLSWRYFHVNKYRYTSVYSRHFVFIPLCVHTVS